jgi:hypothetical protein
MAAQQQGYAVIRGSALTACAGRVQPTGGQLGKRHGEGIFRLHERYIDMADDIEKLVRELLEQVEGSEYRDRHGHPLTMNAVYQRLKEAVGNPP